MAKYAVLLRGVNVGGHRRVPMAQLREMLTAAGFTDVQTLLQSGNAIVASPAATAKVQEQITTLIHKELGFAVDVLIRTHAQLAAVIKANPYPDAVNEPTRLHASFLSADPPKGWLETIDAEVYLPDVFSLGKQVVYIHFAVGAGVSKIDRLFKKMPVIATARNWNTVLKLADLTA
jgi:uncharacterized protein (DUF1697 family)